MAEQVVRFATLADGNRVAFQVMGAGPAVAMLFPYHVNHLELNWRVPLHRGAMQFLARHFTVVSLDFPGAGLSRPFKGHLSLACLSKGLEAVRQCVEVKQLALCAMGAAGLIACDFAARYPQRVTRLVLIASAESEVNRQLLHLRRNSPAVESELRGALLGGIGDKRNAAALAAVARASLDAAALAAWEELLRRERPLAVASKVAAPVLYIHASSDQLVPLAAARALVDRLRAGTLNVVSAQTGMDVWRNRAAVHDIVGFLGVPQEPNAARRTKPKRVRASLYPGALSEREAQVIRLLALGQTSRRIADELFISLNTVAYHLRNIFSKIGASNRTEAAAFAFESGIATRAVGAPVTKPPV